MKKVESPGVMSVRFYILILVILSSGLSYSQTISTYDLESKTIKLPPDRTASQLDDPQGDRYTPPALPFPSQGAVSTTTKLELAIQSTGILGYWSQDPLTGKYSGGIEFPRNSGNNYLFNGALWVGGIVNGDTLVSTGYNLERYYSYDYNMFYVDQLQEFYPPNYNQNIYSTSLNSVANGQSFRTVYVDTFTSTWTVGYYHGPDKERHTPLNIEVIQNSYTKDEQPFKNIVLLDYTIVNHSDDVIEEACIGLYLDPDIKRGCTNTLSHMDDLAGSFRDLGFGYCIDNDGELMGDNCSVDRPLAAVALKPVFSYPPAQDTTFHWWLHNGDFGPRMRGTAEYPYREFTDSILGVPTNDANKYFMMRKPEWDYDQIRTLHLPYEDTSWMLPPSPVFAADIANGHDTRIFMSLGPYTIQPDSAVRVIYALFMGDLVHIVDTNLINLLVGHTDDYHNNLFFDVLKQNAEFASELTTEYLQANDCPHGFEKQYFELDSIKFSWDKNLKEGITGYNLLIKKIPDSLLISKSLPRTDVPFDSIDSDIISYYTTDNSFTLTDFDP
ncbi:MAG: hypothetical protein DWP97_06195, partial [Calditrichaeota bacterium]